MYTSKSKRPQIDQIVNRLHEEVFEGVDCLECGNCCRTTGPMLTSRDIERLAKSTGISESAFVSRYLRKDEVGDFVFKFMPCPFLAENNRCSVYDDRPRACRAYPHTDQSGQLEIADLTRKNARICPAVSRIFQALQSI